MFLAVTKLSWFGVVRFCSFLDLLIMLQRVWLTFRHFVTFNWKLTRKKCSHQQSPTAPIVPPKTLHQRVPIVAHNATLHFVSIMAKNMKRRIQLTLLNAADHQKHQHLISNSVHQQPLQILATTGHLLIHTYHHLEITQIRSYLELVLYL